MTDEFRIRELLEEALESGRTPDEVCAECPELLPAVRRRLRQIRRVERGLEALFPRVAPKRAAAPPAPDQDILPQTSETPMRVQPEGRLERAAIRERRHRSAVALLVLVLVLLGAVCGAGLWLLQSEKARQNDKPLREGSRWTRARIARYNS